MDLVRRLLTGSLTEELRSQLVAEDVLLLEENLPGSATLRRSGGGRGKPGAVEFRGTIGAIAVTRQFVMVWGEGHEQIHVPVGDPRFAAIEVSAERDDRVLFACNLEHFYADRSGRLEVRMRTPRAARIVELVESLKARQAPDAGSLPLGDATMRGAR